QPEGQDEDQAHDRGQLAHLSHLSRGRPAHRRRRRWHHASSARALAGKRTGNRALGRVKTCRASSKNHWTGSATGQIAGRQLPITLPGEANHLAKQRTTPPGGQPTEPTTPPRQPPP